MFYFFNTDKTFDLILWLSFDNDSGKNRGIYMMNTTSGLSKQMINPQIEISFFFLLTETFIGQRLVQKNFDRGQDWGSLQNLNK